MKSLQQDMKKIRLSDEAKSRILSKVKSSGKQQNKKPVVFKAAGFVSAAAVLCFAVIGIVLAIRSSGSGTVQIQGSASEQAASTASEKAYSNTNNPSGPNNFSTAHRSANGKKELSATNDEIKQGDAPEYPKEERPAFTMENEPAVNDDPGVQTSSPSESIINNDPQRAPEKKDSQYGHTEIPVEEVCQWNSLTVNKELYDALVNDKDGTEVYHISVKMTDGSFVYNGRTINALLDEMKSCRMRIYALWYLSSEAAGEDVSGIDAETKDAAGLLRQSYLKSGTDELDAERLREDHNAGIDEYYELTQEYNRAYAACMEEGMKVLPSELDKAGIEYALTTDNDCEISASAAQLAELDFDTIGSYCFCLYE